MSGQRFGPAGIGRRGGHKNAPLEHRFFRTRPSVLICSLTFRVLFSPHVVVATLAAIPPLLRDFTPTVIPPTAAAPLFPIRTVGASIRLGSWVTEQKELGAADVADWDLSRGPSAGSNFVRASTQHLLFQPLHVVGEETFPSCADLNASFECSSYPHLGFTSGGSMAIDSS